VKKMKNGAAIVFGTALAARFYSEGVPMKAREFRCHT